MILDPDRYLTDCFRLARTLWESGYRPDFLVALWRGGSVPGIAIQEYFRWKGHDFYHTAIRTQSLEGVREGNGFDIRGFEHVVQEVNSDHELLIVDDLFNTGRTIYEVVEYLKRRARRNTPNVRVATVYFRSAARRFLVGPDVYLHEIDESPVFPHRLAEMSPEVLRRDDPELHDAVWSTP